MKDVPNIISIQHLKVRLMSTGGIVHAVRDINLEIKPGEIHGILGESGCGKTMTAKSILRLYDEGRLIYDGNIIFNGEKDILSMNKKELENLRSKEIGMIFQEPITTLNPLITIGNQLSEVLRIHLKMTKRDAKARTIELLKNMSVSPAEDRYNQYPFELSGELLQRVIMAMTIACNPKLIIADEPTINLGGSMQTQVLQMIQDLRCNENMAFMIITKYFDVINEVCDTVSIMYAGKIVESGSVREVLHSPKHPYTQELIEKSKIAENSDEKGVAKTDSIKPDSHKHIEGCPYALKCKYVRGECHSNLPDKIRVSKSHIYNCFK